VLAPSINIPGAAVPVGVSIDVDGFVWVVDQAANAAFKVNPDTYQTVATTTGLNQPYTYSDMTGAGLDLVTFPPTE
jgi:streptogramin lyase